MSGRAEGISGPRGWLLGATFGAMLALASSAAAQVPRSVVLPDTPAGQYVKSWLEAVGRGDVRAMQQIDPRAAGPWRQSGGYDLVAVEDASATQVTGIVRERLTGAYVRLTWMFDAATPPKLVGLRGQSASPPPGVPPTERL